MKITSKGQITIPKQLRERWGLSSSTEIEFIEEGSALRIVKKSKKESPFSKVYGILNQKGSSDDWIEKMRGR